MSMPLYAWAAYVHKAVAMQNANILRMSIATSIPHMDKADRAKVFRDLQEPLTAEQPEMSKEEYIAQLSSFGIGVELN